VGSLWTLNRSSVLAVLTGLWLLGTGEATLLDAGIGVSPWTVLAQGLGRQIGESVGTATVIVGIAVLIAWIPLRERVGFGTLANSVVVGVAIDSMRPALPSPTTPAAQVAQVLVGIAFFGVGSALYLTANLGPGPRDGLMTGLHRLLRWPLARIRLLLETSVVAIGTALGGHAGVGTFLFALLIGPTLAIALNGTARVGAMPVRQRG
jgi:uncharacterized membrane protein YczE